MVAHYLLLYTVAVENNTPLFYTKNAIFDAIFAYKMEMVKWKIHIKNNEYKEFHTWTVFVSPFFFR